MHDSHLMQVHDSPQDTLHNLGRIFLGKVLELANLIEQFSSLA